MHFGLSAPRKFYLPKTCKEKGRWILIAFEMAKPQQLLSCNEESKTITSNSVSLLCNLNSVTPRTGLLVNPSKSLKCWPFHYTMSKTTAIPITVAPASNALKHCEAARPTVALRQTFQNSNSHIKAQILSCTINTVIVSLEGSHWGFSFFRTCLPNI